MKVNWREYYREFNRVHGGNPVLYRVNPEIRNSGYLLFQDGYSYARGDTSGPEYPPPDDPEKHLALVKYYWHTRRRIMEVEYNKLKDTIESLLRAQQSRSANLQVLGKEETEQGEVSVYKSIDFQSLIGRLEAMVEEMSYCSSQVTNATISAVDKFNPLDVITKLEQVSGRADT
jgi:hypothetical protein